MLFHIFMYICIKCICMPTQNGSVYSPKFDMCMQIYSMYDTWQSRVWPVCGFHRIWYTQSV